MRYWWVNQNQTYTAETKGGYMWSPKRNKTGARNRFYDNMMEVMPGDLVFSYRNTRIAALGRILTTGYECPKPEEFGDSGACANWSKLGWRVDVKYVEIPTSKQFRPKDFIDKLRPMLPNKYSPLQHQSGHGLQSVYLAEISQGIADFLMSCVRNNGGPKPPPPPPDVASDNELVWKERIEQQCQVDLERTPMPDTEREALVKARRGQGQFKQAVREHEKKCRVTGISNIKYLIASHIWPWRHASNEERLDGENGLLLAPHVDFLFDRGLISFSDTGQLLVSPVADSDVLRTLRIEEGMCAGSFTVNQRAYLKKHREGEGQHGGIFKAILRT